MCGGRIGVGTLIGPRYRSSVNSHWSTVIGHQSSVISRLFLMTDDYHTHPHGLRHLIHWLVLKDKLDHVFNCIAERYHLGIGAFPGEGG